MDDFQEKNGNFIKLSRKILDWEWYQDPCTRSLFIHCLLKANWKDQKWKGYDCKRGQLITSLPSLAQQTGFTVQQIRTAIKKLKSTGEITDWHDSRVRIITVKNYDKYQSSTDNLTGEQQSSNSQATGEQQHYKNNKNNKNIRREENISALSRENSSRVITIEDAILQEEREKKRRLRE